MILELGAVAAVIARQHNGTRRPVAGTGSRDASSEGGRQNLKYLVVIALLALLLVLLLRRLRPYFRIAQEFIKTFRNFQQMSAMRANARNQQPEKLVCCETCGTWVPIGRALTAGSSDSVYCSTDCLSPKKRRKQATS